MWRFLAMTPPHLSLLEIVRLLLWEFLLQFAAVCCSFTANGVANSSIKAAAVLCKPGK
jgi:hypothetical protein